MLADERLQPMWDTGGFISSLQIPQGYVFQVYALVDHRRDGQIEQAGDHAAEQQQRDDDGHDPEAQPALILEETDDRVKHVSHYPSYGEGDEHTAQIVDGGEDQREDGDEDEASYETVERDFLLEHTSGAVERLTALAKISINFHKKRNIAADLSVTTGKSIYLHHGNVIRSPHAGGQYGRHDTPGVADFEGSRRRIGRRHPHVRRIVETFRCACPSDVLPQVQ